MGRQTGWLTHASAFAKVDPRGILVPERPPHIFVSWETPLEADEFLLRVQNAVDQFGTATIAVGEDIQLVELLAKQTGSELEIDDNENIVFGAPGTPSTGNYLANLIEKELDVHSIVQNKVKTATLAPQHIQRSMMLSPVDASDAYLVGWQAVEAIAEGHTGQSVVLQRDGHRTTTALTPVSNIANQIRRVESDYHRGLDGPTQKFVNEFIDLTGGPMAIPHYTAPQMQILPSTSRIG